jgi:2'-5' RNA ligase
MRLFIAINFAEDMKDYLVNIVSELQKIAAGSFTARENLHLTLAFIGETNRVDDVRAAMDAVPAEPFLLSVKGAGSFKGRGGETVWAGIEAEAGLYRAQSRLRSELTSRGFEIDGRKYAPHLTLARRVVFDRGRGALDLLPCAGGKTVEVCRISLMKSESVRGRLTYTEIYGRNLNEKFT